jgi:uncharacterized protein
MPDPIIINADDLRAIGRLRESLLYGSLDGKRPRAWEQFGYPETLTPEQLLQAYLRNPAAKSAVDQTINRCWQEWPRVKLKNSDDESPWERRLNGILEKVDAWSKIQEWDRRNMVARYAGLVLRVADGKQLREPLLKAARLVDLVPLYEHQLRVTSWDSDTSSETHGQPLMWQYRQRSNLDVDAQGRPDQWVDVHPSRMVILAEGSVGDDFLAGVPMLSASYNSLVDLEKVTGAAAESQRKNSAGHLKFIFDKDADPTKLVAPKADGTAATPDDVRDVVNDRARRLIENSDAAIVAQGADVETLQTQLHDPRGSWEIAANMAAAGFLIPFTIMFGNREGQLASEQDDKAMNALCKSRQRNLLTRAVTAVIRRLQGCGVVEPSDFEVEWAPLDAPGDEDKAELGDKMAGINEKMVKAGHAPPFTPNEVRKVMDYEEVSELPDMPSEGDPGGDDLDQEPLRKEPQPAPTPTGNALALPDLA